MLTPMMADSEIGRVDDAHLAELVVHALRDAKCAAVSANVFAEHEHVRIAAHLFDERLADRFQVAQLFRPCLRRPAPSPQSPVSSPQSRQRSVTASAGSGSGEFMANSTASSMVALTRASVSVHVIVGQDVQTLGDTS